VILRNARRNNEIQRRYLLVLLGTHIFTWHFVLIHTFHKHFNMLLRVDWILPVTVTLIYCCLNPQVLEIVDVSLLV